MCLGLSRILVVVQPFSIQMRETAGQAMSEGYIIEDCGPEFLEINVENVI